MPACRPVPVEDITLKYWQEVLDVNLTAAFLCSREAVRIMKSQTCRAGVSSILAGLGQNAATGSCCRTRQPNLPCKA